jgi:hypothetical protein
MQPLQSVKKWHIIGLLLITNRKQWEIMTPCHGIETETGHPNAYTYKGTHDPPPQGTRLGGDGFIEIMSQLQTHPIFWLLRPFPIEFISIYPS